MRIGKLARLTGVSIRMLRYYEDQGLLTPGRTESGYRTYAEDDVQRVSRIRVLNKAGLTLDQIRPVLGCAIADGRPPCDALKETIRRTIARLDEQIHNLTSARQTLMTLAEPV